MTLLQAERVLHREVVRGEITDIELLRPLGDSEECDLIGRHPDGNKVRFIFEKEGKL